MTKIKYSIQSPTNVEDIAQAFEKKIKRKISHIKLKRAKDGKPSILDLVFSPVVSRAGTDIDAAVSKIKDNKMAILVVLHHTFDTEAIVSNSSKYVKKENVKTVDCLFYEDKGLLNCKKNDEAYKEVAEWLKKNKKKLKVSKASKHSKKSSQRGSSPTDGPSNAEDNSTNDGQMRTGSRTVERKSKTCVIL